MISMRSKVARLAVALDEEYHVKWAKSFKVLERGFSLAGFEYGFPLCCVIWFWDVDCTLRKTIPEYNSRMNELTDDRGQILCPDCLVDRLAEFCVAP